LNAAYHLGAVSDLGDSDGPADLGARQENRLECTQQRFTYPRLLILDELGYLPMLREEASLFFRLLVRRYERRELDCDQQQEFRGLGRSLQRSGIGHGDFILCS
jgi:DNA replication protein DnaC